MKLKFQEVEQCIILNHALGVTLRIIKNTHLRAYRDQMKNILMNKKAAESIEFILGHCRNIKNSKNLKFIMFSV